MSSPTGDATPTTPPPAEVVVDEALVRGLLEDQHADIADRRLVLAAEGWDNVTFRAGDDLAVRLPRRQLGAAMLDVELRWLPAVADQLPIATSTAVRRGAPGRGYPWHWAVVPWIAGDQASTSPPAASEAGRLGEFLAALHTIALPESPPINPYRSDPLAGRVEVTNERLARLEGRGRISAADRSRLASIFAAGATAPRGKSRTWIHGDLHPRNVIVRDRQLVGVIDWGDMCAGDPSTDLGVAWLLFEPDHHDDIWSARRPDATMLTRARAWVVAFGAMFQASGDPELAPIGATAYRRLLG